MVNKKLFKLLSTLIVTFSVLLTSCSSNSSQGTNSGNSSNNGGGGSSNTSHEHTFDDKWEYNDTYHWHSSTCGHDVKANEERHNFTSTVTDPTYEEGGYTTYTCSACGYSYVDNETDKLEHNYSSSWSYDENSHWHACTDIGYEHLKKDESSHNFTSIVTDPTYEEGGYTTYTCSTCGYSYVDNKTDPLFITITRKNYDGTILEVDNNVSYGTTPTYEGATPIKESDSRYKYTFAGWTPEVVIATKDATYTAVFSEEKITYTIDFDLNGGSSSSYKGPIEVKIFSKDIFFFDCVKEDWQFRGWEYNGEKIFDEKGNQLKNVTLVDDMVFKAICSQTVKLTITTNMPEAGTILGDGEYPYNTYVDVSVTPNQGYKFVGWYFEDILLSNSLNYNYTMRNKDVILEARFDLDSFSLRIFSNNSTQGLVLLKSETNIDYLTEYTEEREFTSEVTIVAYSKTDVRFLGWFDESNVLVSANAVYTFNMPNHDYVLEARRDYYNISYNLNGGINNHENPTNYSSTDNIVLSEATKDGFDFVGWKYKGEFVDTVGPNMEGDITLEAVWSSYQYEIKTDLNGEKYACIKNYQVSNSDVIIPEYVKHNYQKIPVKELADNLFENNNVITSIKIPDSIEKIGDYAFYFCNNLSNVYMSENSNISSIGKYAFYLTNITSFLIPSSTSYLGSCAFDESTKILCEAVSKPDGRDEKRHGQASDPYVIWGYLGISGNYDGFDYIVSEDEKSEKYISIIKYLGSDKDVIIPNYIEVNSENVYVRILKESAFEDSIISSVTISDNITKIEASCFRNCRDLNNIVLNKASHLKTIGNFAFYRCNRLNSINIPSYVESIGTEAFAYCTGLKTIFLSKNLSLLGVQVFYGCDKLTIYCGIEAAPEGREDDLSNYNVVRNAESYNEDKFTYYVVTDNDNEKYAIITGYYGQDENINVRENFELDGMLVPVKKIEANAFKDNTIVKSIDLPASIESIGEYAFSGCKSLKTFTIAKNSCLKEIGSYAFNYCSSLESISVPKSLESLGSYCFYFCTSLKSCAFEDESLLSYIGDGAFCCCESLESIKIPYGVADLPLQVFFCCTSLTYVEIPNSVNSIGVGAFRRCDSLTTVNIPSSVVFIGNGAFNGSKKLKTVIINDNSQLTTIGDRAFQNCCSLSSINIPDSVTTIGYHAFDGCSSLTSIYIPDSVTTIGEYAFWGCSNLTTVTISENSQLTTIGREAFYGCSSLTSIYIPISVATIGNYAFRDCSNLTIYCEVSFAPSGWSSTWNYSNRPVVWNCTYDKYLEAIS